jgi:hypothetical protein
MDWMDALRHAQPAQDLLKPADFHRAILSRLRSAHPTILSLPSSNAALKKSGFA